MKYSIIVPIYNSEKYIENTINSILNQDILEQDSLELLLINDGSKDNTNNIIENILKNNKENSKLQIKYITIENSGVSKARNVGLDKATGDYIIFVDSDDLLEEGYIREFSRVLDNKKYDIVFCDIIIDNSDINKENSIKEFNYLIEDNISYKQKSKIIKELYPVVFAKAIKKEILNDIYFSENKIYEDISFNYKIIARINSISYIKKPLYRYFQRKNSITHTINQNINKIYNILDAAKEIYVEYMNNGLYLKYKDEVEYSIIRYIRATFLKRIFETNDDEIIKKGIEDTKAILKELNIDLKKAFRTNKYLRIPSIKNIFMRYPIIFWKYIFKLLK